MFFFFLLWPCDPTQVMASSFLMFLDHTQRRISRQDSAGRVISSSQRRLPHNRQTSMPLVGFKPTISAGEWPQTYALDSAATGTGLILMCGVKISVHATLLQNLFVIFWFYHANGNAKTILEIFMVFTFNYGNSAVVVVGGGGGGGGGKKTCTLGVVILSTFQHWKWPPHKWLPNNYLPIYGSACAVHLNLLEVTNLNTLRTVRVI